MHLKNFRTQNWNQQGPLTQDQRDAYKLYKDHKKNSLMDNFNKSTRGKIYNSSLGKKVRALPKGGKWAGLIGGTIAAGSLAGSIYDGLVNRH